jgi:hypothetical protein
VHSKEDIADERRSIYEQGRYVGGGVREVGIRERWERDRLLVNRTLRSNMPGVSADSMGGSWRVCL